jgi:microcystin-dependent protein
LVKSGCVLSLLHQTVGLCVTAPYYKCPRTQRYIVCWVLDFRGDGSKTFGLPDLRGRTMLGQLGGYDIGTKGGAETVTLTSENMPAHYHLLCVSDAPANAANVGMNANRLLAASNIYSPSTPNPSAAGKKLYAKADNSSTLSSTACTPVGGGGAHNNMQASLVINFMISTKDWYAGEIPIFAGNYAPVGWEFCDGRSMQITNFEILYALIGVTYGGDGVNTFKLPNLNQTLPIGQGFGLTNRKMCKRLGEADSVRLSRV